MRDLKKKEFPKIGENIERFIEVFGTPARESSNISYLFDVKDVPSRLTCGVHEGKVYNIGWSLPYDVNQVREVALRFLPEDAQLISEGAFEVKRLVNGDVPIKQDIYKLRDREEDVMFGVGKDSTFAIDLNIFNVTE